MERQVEPPTYLLACVVGMLCLDFLVPVVRLISGPWRCLGALPILAGLAVNVWADQIFKRVGTTVKPSEVPTLFVVRGPFRFSRHPMYLGMAAVLIGVAVALGTLTPWIALPVFIAVMEVRFIPGEERAMEREFGEPYRDYRKKVGCWF